MLDTYHEPKCGGSLILNVIYASTRSVKNGVTLQVSSKKQEKKLLKFLSENNHMYYTINNNPVVYVISSNNSRIELSVAQNKDVMAFNKRKYE